MNSTKKSSLRGEKKVPNETRLSQFSGAFGHRWVSTRDAGTTRSTLAEPDQVIVIGVPESEALPGRFPGAEPYIPAARGRIRRRMRRFGKTGLALDFRRQI